MAKHTRLSHYREDLSETPEWLKKKKCPHRDKFLSGKRILPKNLTGKEALADVVDDTFLGSRKSELNCFHLLDLMFLTEVFVRRLLGTLTKP